jgi:hypothetical protein
LSNRRLSAVELARSSATRTRRASCGTMTPARCRYDQTSVTRSTRVVSENVIPIGNTGLE